MPLLDAGWIAVRSGEDRREKLVEITKAGTAKLAQARPAWDQGAEADAGPSAGGSVEHLMAILPEVSHS